MAFLYALRVSKGDGTEPLLIPILPGEENVAKELANRYAAAARDVGDFSYEVLRTEIDWQPYEGDD